MENAAGDFMATLLLGLRQVLGAQASIHKAAHLLIHLHGLLKTLSGSHAERSRIVKATNQSRQPFMTHRL
jgi:hypothetical protein